MIILGLACYYHDAAVTLIRDGRIVAAAEEERFTRKKHDNRFPELAIDYCLKSQGLTTKDIDLVCFYEKPLLKLERILTCGKNWHDRSATLVRRQLSQSMHEHLFLDKVLAEKIGYTGPIKYIDHHLAHAASSYYISDFPEAAIMTVDGVGEWASTVQFTARGNQITRQREIRYPHSLGLLYSTITAFLGFKVNNDEYKVMGLASYGKPTQVDKVRKLITFLPDSSYRLETDYFDFMFSARRMYSDTFIEMFGEPRVAESELTAYHMDLAASVQQVLEEGMLALGNSLHELSGGMENVCMAGGVALNCVANSLFMQKLPFKQVSIQPAAGDGGGAMGAALYAWYEQNPQAPRHGYRHTTRLGPEYDTKQIKEFLDSVNATYTEFDEAGICRKTAELINKNQIIGWFQGRMEYGPRALGSRSILANACNPDMKDILNARVKFREDFRPFAPAVLREKSREYFDIPFESPYMLFIADVMPGKGEKIPSVTHVDNTARLQTVDRDENPLYYRMIEEFEKLSGVPVVINTSFNVRGEPIVCSMQDAYNCFMKTDIDFLIMGNFLVEKEI